MLYNGLIAVKNNVDKAWANIDVLLKQRHDELPNLIEVCKGYMKYEGDTFERVTKARSEYSQAQSVDQKVEASAAVPAHGQAAGYRGKLSRVESQQRFHAPANAHQRIGEPDRRSPRVLQRFGKRL